MRNCPICGSDRKRDQPSIAAKSPAELQEWDEVKNSFIGLRAQQTFFSYFHCLQCGLLYCPLYFQENQLAELYKSMPDNLLGESRGTALKTQSRYADYFSSGLTKVENYLELGPDVGLVSKTIGEKFKPKNAVLVEPNQSIYAELRRNSTSFGNIVITSDENSLPENANSDLIVGVHVFDHLIDPVSSLIKLRDSASDIARIGIVVHDENSIISKLLKTKWPPYCLQHPQLYNKKTLSRLLEVSGWEVETTSKSTNYFHLDNIATMLLSVLGITLNLRKVIPHIQVPIKLGNIIARGKNSVKNKNPDQFSH